MPTSKRQSEKVDPFKTRKTRRTEGKEQADVKAPADIAAAIDAFRECEDQAKHFEGEATIHKNQVLDFARQEFVRRARAGQNLSFKIHGNEAIVTYVVQDSSAGLTEEEVSDIAQRWGETAADQLVTRDFRSIRFDPKVLETHYDAVVSALQQLPEDVLSSLFKPMLMMARPGALETAKRIAKDEDELRDLLHQLKMKAYIR